MVQSSYKNRKRNMTQSFKRRSVGGTRNVDFIEDKMVGGESGAALLAELVKQFGKHIQWPIIKFTLTNAGDCDANTCKEDNIAKQLANMKKTLESIIDTVYKKNGITVPEIDGNDASKYIKEAVKFILNTPIVGKPMEGEIYTLYVQMGDDEIRGYTTALVEKVEQSAPDTKAAGGAEEDANMQLMYAAAEAEKKAKSINSDAAGGSGE